jgi:hypothetical protein
MDKNNKELKDDNKDDTEAHLIKKNVDKDNKKENDVILDPLKVKQCEPNSDVYTMYWAGLRKDVWEKVSSEGDYKDLNLYLTHSNIVNMVIQFLIFCIIVFFTLVLILYQVFTTEIEVICPIQITILRILLVYLCQCNLTCEFRESLTKLKHTVDYSENYTHVIFARLICLTQLIVATASYTALLLFICTEVSPLEMIMDFTGIVVFVELDDWIGDKICSTQPSINNEKMELIKNYYSKEKLNEEMSLFVKLSTIQGQLAIHEDTNRPFLSWTLSIFRKNKYILYFLPLLVLLVERLFIAYHPYVVRSK